MIDNKFIYFNTTDAFLRRINDIPSTSITFIGDRGLIYTHGQYFGRGSSSAVNLSLYVTQDQLNQKGFITADDIPQQDGIKHIFLTQLEYNALESYEDNAVYFIIERSDEGWHFGDTFPITFTGEEWQFGNTFPITFKQSWTFGLSFPITLK